MNYKKIKILSWNVRGLGSDDKCAVVRDVIRTSRCDVLFLQETKCSHGDCAYFSRVLPTFFDERCVTLDARNTAGGCMIAWKFFFTFLSAWVTKHTLSVLLKQHNSVAMALYNMLWSECGQ